MARRKKSDTDESLHSTMIDGLMKSQDADTDNRNRTRDAHLFIKKRDGQWEPYWWEIKKDEPRYTFDLTSPIIDDIAGSMEQADFGITVDPADGQATEGTAETLNGLIRNIQKISKANNTFNSSGRSMVIGGMDGWRVVQKFIDDDSFDQDLVIENINNYVDRVWFDVNAEEQDASDAKECWVMHALTPEEYEEKYPDGNAQSVTNDQVSQAYFDVKDVVIVGEYYFIKETERELVLMSNGKIHEAEELDKITDELRDQGLTNVVEVERRKRTKQTVFIRKFDQNSWLEEEKETVFSTIPVVPEYANYSVFENKIIYYGAVEKEIDPQRILNYSISREISETSLAPRDKILATKEMVAGNEDTFETMNTNNDAVQIFSWDQSAPGERPSRLGNSQVNPGLRIISDNMINMMDRAANRFDASRGDNPNNQSGVAVKALMRKSDTGNIKFSTSAEIAIERTCDILIKAIPKVYTGERIIRILGEDGTAKMVQLNQTIRDEETGEDVVINDLSLGKYGVTCTVGPSFDSRQDDTVSSILEAARIYAPIMETGADIFANNIPSPGMTDIAERLRRQRFESGVIPPSQWNDEEKAEVQREQEAKAQQQEQPDPQMIAAQALLIEAKNEEARTQVDVQEKGAKIQLAARKEDREDFKAQNKAQNEQANFGLKQDSNSFDQFMAIQQQQQEQITTILNDNKIMAETLKLIREGQGIDTFTGPGAQSAFIDQAENLHESVENAGEESALSNL